MRIDEIEFELVELPRTERFVIATGASDVVRNWIVRMYAEGMVGYGAAAPNSVTRETVDTVKISLDALRHALVDHDIEDPVELHRLMASALDGAPAAKAGLDLAFHDLVSRIEGIPLCEYLGGRVALVLTDITIGIMGREEAVQRAIHHVRQGFKALKIKVGTSLRADIERVVAIREALGEGVLLCADANQGYTVEEALEFAAGVAEAELQFLEQPVKAEDMDALGMVARASPVPIMADEAVHDAGDARHAFEKGIGLVNIKLMKCAGIHGAVEIAALAREMDRGTMIGCMGETGISIAGALHFASACRDVVRWADLDSHFMLVHDVCSPPRFESGMLWPEGPGNGVRIV
ncbi:MAG: dipeptide epimerase [Candidatus Thermoplasmatota archaeon]